MSRRDELWQQIWRAQGDSIRYVCCIQHDQRLRFEIINPDRQNQIEAMFDIYADAVAWLKKEQFSLDSGDVVISNETPRRLTPQEKKRLSYLHDHHSMSTGTGASRRVQQIFPKLRRRQYRRRAKAYLRRETRNLFRDITDQSFRSIRAEGVPTFSRSVPLDEALEEKRRRRQSQEAGDDSDKSQTTAKPPLRKRGAQGGGDNDGDRRQRPPLGGRNQRS